MKITKGSLIPLNDYIEKYPIAKERVTMKDGNIYNLPTVCDCYHCKSTQKLWIYKPWLDKLNLEVPTTTG